MNRIIKLVAVALLVCLLLTACGSTGERDFSASVLVPNAGGSDVISNSAAVIDFSNSSEGYIMVKYLGGNEKVKLQISMGGTTYTYEIIKRGEYEVFPLSLGDGSYKAAVYENVSGTKYSLCCGGEKNVKLKSEVSPFLYPNQYVDYTAETKAVKLSEKLAEGCESDLAVVTKVFDYVTQKIKYDYSLAEQLSGVTGVGYIPNLDNILDTGTGICFDYASLMAALLRCQRIPTKVNIGYVGTEYHAWISVFIDDIGWVNGIIQFDGKNWTRMDPTLASTGSFDQMKDDAAYNALYFY